MCKCRDCEMVLDINDEGTYKIGKREKYLCEKCFSEDSNYKECEKCGHVFGCDDEEMFEYNGESTHICKFCAKECECIPCDGPECGDDGMYDKDKLQLLDEPDEDGEDVYLCSECIVPWERAEGMDLMYPDSTDEDFW